MSGAARRPSRAEALLVGQDPERRLEVLAGEMEFPVGLLFGRDPEDT